MTDHLRIVEPAAAVYEVTQHIRREIVAQYGVLLEIEAFEETRTVHDGRRLSRALRHITQRADLALQVSALIGDCPHCGEQDVGRCGRPTDCLWTN